MLNTRAPLQCAPSWHGLCASEICGFVARKPPAYKLPPMSLLDDPRHANFAIAELGDLLLVEAFGPAPPEAVKRLEEAAIQFGRARPGRAVFMHCVSANARNEMPGDATRQAMVSFAKNAAQSFRCATLLLETPGFSGAAFRSLFAGIFFLARLELPLKIQSDATAALAWLRQHSPSAALPDIAQVTRERARLWSLMP